MRDAVLSWQEPLVLACRKHGVPPSLAAAIMDAESGGRQFNADGSVVTSSAGARGLMQLMPGTAEGLGVNPDDPHENIDGGVRYLAEQYARFGDYRKVVAAYNAGPLAVEEYAGVPPFAETERYMRIVQVLLIDYLHLDSLLIWGADPAHAPATGSFQEALANVVGVANARKAQIAHLREEADRALQLA